MPLYKIKDFDPNYRDHFDGDDVKQLDLYSGTERVGAVDDVLVDADGRFRYLVINTGAWIFGKKVLLPIGLAQINYSDRRVYANGLTREQVENLPEFNSDMVDKYDYNYEEQVRGVYRPSVMDRNSSLESSASLDASAPLEREAYSTPSASTGMSTPNQMPMTSFDRDTYNYDREPRMFNMTDRDHGQLRLYEERLIANKRREKTGEVAVGKRVETETARVSVPVEKERVVIERNPVGSERSVVASDAAFQEGEVARVEVFEETPDIHKEAFVREEVSVRKVVDRDTVNAEDQIRREELDVNTQGNPVIDKKSERI